MAVVCVTEVERQLRQVARATSQTIGRNPRAELLGIAPQADARRLAKDTGQVERRASEGTGEISQSGRRFEALVDRELHGLHEVAPPPTGCGRRRTTSPFLGVCPIDHTNRFVGELRERVVEGQRGVAPPDTGEQLVMEVGDAT
jgi:hypothetical protein